MVDGVGGDREDSTGREDLPADGGFLCHDSSCGKEKQVRTRYRACASNAEGERVREGERLTETHSRCRMSSQRFVDARLQVGEALGLSILTVSAELTRREKENVHLRTRRLHRSPAESTLRRAPLRASCARWSKRTSARAKS